MLESTGICVLFQLFVTMMSIISNCELKLFCMPFTALYILSLVIKTCLFLYEGFKYSRFFSWR